MTIQSHIFAYIFGTLSNADKQEWESHLIQNQELKADIQALRKLLEEKSIASEEDYEKLLPQRKESLEIEEYLEKIERIIRRIKHREYVMSFLEPDENVSSEEKAEFDAELQQNETLQKKVAEIKEMTELIKTAQYVEKAEAIWAYIQTQEKAEQEKKSIPIWRKTWAIAAAIFMFIGVSVGIYLIIGNSQVYDKQYFADNYLSSPYPISGKMGKADDFQKIIGLYNQQQYQSVINELEKVGFEDNSKADMMLAMSYIYTKQYEKSTVYLEKLLTNEDYSNDARKYLSILYILKGDKTKAEMYLNEILKFSNNITEKEGANKILEELKKMK